MSGTIDWERIARKSLHPLRLRILELMCEADEPLSAKQLSERLEIPLNQMSYHVRCLVKAGLLELVRTEQVRGSLARYYVLR